ncbi:hypothetical protein [Candidatus Chromulinivorax destructor]|uniref:Uncharacterized protein n=1 Tax=Candidatus Chromulinivorax destructor TaxID=2066483 RepID=A0A345ZCL1_9BACT|nr:hypothetical protein [Candidatus Chromulinivorax destructor]AXK61028.1 hypothetical protein C0J27_04835 [Candidatus Chromulinivorax destructor]
MKKWYLVVVVILCSLVYADKNNDDFNLHANSWSPALNQPGGATRKYVNSVDGMECFITETDSKKIITSYDCYGNKLHTFDLFYGSSQESDFLSLFPQAAGSSSGHSSPPLPTNYNTPRLSSPQQLQQFIEHQENARPGKRARSFQNSITDQQILSNRYLAGDATDEEVRAYYENLAVAQAYAEQQEQDRLQAIADLKALQKRHAQEWNQLRAQQHAALAQEKKNHKDKHYIKRLRASQEQARNELLLQQYAENPTMAKYFYLGCKNMKDGVSSLFGTQYNPLPTQQSTIISPDQIEEDRALITYAQQHIDTHARSLDDEYNLLDQSKNLSHPSPQDEVELQNIHDEHVELLATIAENAPQEFIDVMQDRLQALHDSLQNPTPRVVNYHLQDDTIKTLQAYNIDPAIFLSTDGVAIHQQLTQELVDMLDNLGAIAVKNPTNIAMQESSLMCAQVAALAQQENKIHHLAQAVSATNCTHGLFHYLDGLTQHGFEKCESMMQSLAYFSTELAKYTGSVARGTAQGIIATEISSAALGAVGSLASSCAPVLTATISSAASAAIIPIVLTAGCVCATVAVGELAQLGYFYATDQMVSFHEECAGITKFASQFYDFNQTSYQHVENVSQAVATVVWPRKGQAIVNALQGLQTVHCDLYVAGEKLVQKSFATTKDVVARAQSMVEHHQLDAFNGLYKKIMGEHYFDFFKKEQLKLAGVLDSVSMHDLSLFLPANTHVLLQKSIEEKIITSGVSQLGQHAIESANKLTPEQMADFIACHSHEVIALQNTVQQEIMQQLNRVQTVVDLTIPISSARAVQLAELAPSIRQLQELAKKTANFTNMHELIQEDIMYLNRVYNLQTYKQELLKFLQEHRPFFIYEGQKYYVEDVASYHIHAGDYFLKHNPDGGHSNYGGNKLDHFSSQLIKHGPAGSKDLLFTNPRNKNRTKKSSIYPEAWSELLCDLKAIEAMTSNQISIKKSDDLKMINITGFTPEKIEIKICYDIANKRIKTHHPLI